MKMFFLTLLACLMAAVCAGPSQTLGESKLLQAMRSTNALQQNNPARSMECFQYYSEVFDQLLQEYEVQYQTCENNTQLQLSTLDWLYQTKLSILGNNAQSACQLIENCDSLNDTAAALNCYTQVGTEDAKTMYNISGTASQYNIQYKQQKEQINYQLEQCSTEAKNTYEVNTEQTYVRLQACLLGAEPVPSTSTKGGTNSLITTTTTVSSTPIVTTPPNTSSSPMRPTSSPSFSTTTASSTKGPKRTTTTTVSSTPIVTTPPNTSSSPMRPTSSPSFTTTTASSTKGPKRTTTANPATNTTTGAYTTNSLPVSKSTTVTTTSTSRRPISTIRPIITTTTSAPVTTTTKSETMTTDSVSSISSSSTSSSSSISSSNTTLPIPLGSTTASLGSTTLPVPLATSSSLVTVKPTVSAAPSLSSDLKKLLHSLLH